jgi:hypothetical protein
MTQQYLRKLKKLSSIKDSLYDLASHKFSTGDKTGQTATYTEIDDVNAAIDALMKANQEPVASDEELTLRFDN